MTERDFGSEKKRCSNCCYGNQIVAIMEEGIITDDGIGKSPVPPKIIPVGQTRNCFNRFQKILGTSGENFIYPKQDDTCVNPNKFKLK